MTYPLFLRPVLISTYSTVWATGAYAFDCDSDGPFSDTSNSVFSGTFKVEAKKRSSEGANGRSSNSAGISIGGQGSILNIDNEESAAVAYARPGLLLFLTDPDINVGAQLSDLSSATLTSTFHADRLLGEVAFGLEVNASPNVTVAFEGSGSMSENSRSAGASLELKWNF